MHIDARDLPNNSLIEGDICIVGAGAAGISIALDWNNTPFKVILLESGGFEYEDEVQDLNGGELTGRPYYPLKSSRLRYFGGTTGHWAGMCSPFDPIDFAKRDWVPDSGWPISRDDLEPFYAKAHSILKLGPCTYDFDYWAQQLPNLTPFPLDKKVVWNKMWQYTTARFGSMYKDTIIETENIHLYTYANVVNIIANANVSNVKELIIKNHAGKTHQVKAKHFILACGAIQNARLLLASNTQMQQGLGNRYDLVGRYFMEHLEIPSAEFWLLKPFPTDLYSWEYGVTPASAELAITEEVQREERILNGTVSLSPLTISRHIAPKTQTFKGDDPRKAMENMMNDWHEAEEIAKKDNKGSIARAYQLVTRIEQAPNPSSHVTLGSEKDALGVPRPNLHWQLSELDKFSIRKIYQLLGQQVGIANIGRIKLLEFLQDPDNSTWPEGVDGGWHHMGTTRMSEQPQKGVVDANCQVHGLSNLFVAGSGCYPTSGAPNPTLTLIALSLRLSNYLRKRMGQH